MQEVGVMHGDRDDKGWIDDFTADGEIIRICIKCGKIHQIKEDDLEGKNYVSPTFIPNCKQID